MYATNKQNESLLHVQKVHVLPNSIQSADIEFVAQLEVCVLTPGFAWIQGSSWTVQFSLFFPKQGLLLAFLQ